MGKGHKLKIHTHKYNGNKPMRKYLSSYKNQEIQIKME